MMKYRAHKEEGFSMVELLVAMAVMLVLTGAVMALLPNSLRVLFTNNEMADLQQNLRFGQEFINRDLYNVGDGVADFKPQVRKEFMLNYLSQDLVNATAPFLPAGLVAVENQVPNGTPVLGTPTATTVLQNTDRLTLVMQAETGGTPFVPIPSIPLGTFHNNGINEMYVSAASAALVDEGEIYLLANGGDSSRSAFVRLITKIDNGSGLFRLQFKNSGDYGLNSGVISLLTDDSDITTDDKLVKLSLMKVWLVHYFVDNNKRLIRRVFGQKDPAGSGSGFTDHVVAEHVTNLQLRFTLRGFDTATFTPLPPEIVDEFADADKQESVRQIQVSLTAETVHPMQNGNRSEITNTTITSPRNLQFSTVYEP